MIYLFFWTWPQIVLIFFFACLLTALCSNLGIKINLLRENNNDISLKVSLKFLLIRITREFYPGRESGLPAGEDRQFSKNGAAHKVDFKTTPYDIRAALAPDIIKRYRQVWRLFSRYARWQQLDVSIRIGWSDSFLTGLGSGVIWAAGSNLFAVIDRHLGFEDGCPRLRIYPDFAGRGFKLNLDASFSIRPVFLLRILVDTAKILIKIIGKQKEVTADYG